jgi:hypothetical protein
MLQATALAPGDAAAIAAPRCVDGGACVPRVSASATSEVGRDRAQGEGLGAARRLRGRRTVGDPFKDTSSVALNPVIKFTTLFGLLAVELAIELEGALRHGLAAVFFAISLVFVWRSFYRMRIEQQ